MPKLSSDQELIEGCLNNQRLAQKLLYEKYSSRMLGLCMRYIRDDFEAEEAMIGGFMKVFSKISQFKNEGSFEGWIKRIMVNECLNFLRKKRWLYAEVDIANVSDNMDYSRYESEFDTEELLNLIDRLPIGYRTVFNLYAIEGYSHKEIADMLGISENTSKSQLSRARGLLQKLINNSDKTLNNISHG
ncbi:MAG: sigma-70 family RNA polymerase sigma factor [Microscillaceae bacterium]|nr:sigma-70 family RNA polymerase sigma factor [Microscillaceae bacterium]